MWQFESGKAIYLQIVDKIEEWILGGEYACGEVLPSVRVLAEAAGVNPNTMQHALVTLEEQGLVYSVTTSGRFVTEDQELIEARREAKAKKLVDHCLMELKKLGYEKEEAIKLLGKNCLEL